MAKYVALRNRYRYKQLSSTEEEKKEKKTKMGSPKLPSCIISVCEPVCVCVCVLVDGVRNPKSIYYYHRTSYRHKEPEHLSPNFVCAVRHAQTFCHTNSSSLCSGSLCP